MITGYCGHCGRGDCSPTADQWAEQRQRADKAEAEVERMKLLVAASSEDGQAARMAARFAEKANANQRRAEKAEAAIARVRALHAPTANLSWPAFSCTCESVSTHTRACSQCQRCHPCPTLRALDGTT